MKRFKLEEGATAVEYGILVGGIALVAVVAVPGLLDALGGLLETVLCHILGDQSC